MDYNEIHYKPPRWWTSLRTNYKNTLKKNSRPAIALVVLVYFLHWALFSSPTVPKIKVPSESVEGNMKTYGANMQARFNIMPVSSTPLRDRLAYYHPYEPEKPISNKIWQTWKVGLDDPKFPKNFQKFQQSWTEINQGYNHMVIPDHAIADLISQMYATTPEVYRAFELLPSPIMKADFFRYLLLFARGGVYSDMDTVALKPISSWPLFNESIVGSEGLDVARRLTPIGLSVGIEADPDRPDWSDWYARRLQFCQWTIQSKRGHPMLRELIVRIVDTTLRRHTLGNLDKVEGKDPGGDVMNWTGPAVFTDTLFDYLNNVVTKGNSKDGIGIGSTYHNEHKLYKKENLAEAVKLSSSTNREISWERFTKMKEPRIVDDVLVMPITSFSPGVEQMGAQREDHWLALVKHMFEGSWKPTSERHIGIKKGKKAGRL